MQVEKLVKPTPKILQSTSSFFKLGNGGLFVLFSVLGALERLNKHTIACSFFSEGVLAQQCLLQGQRTLGIPPHWFCVFLKVMILITGAHKAFALHKAIEEGVNHMWTVSAFQQHPSTIFVCDEPATNELRVRTVKYFKGLMEVHNRLVEDPDTAV